MTKSASNRLSDSFAFVRPFPPVTLTLRIGLCLAAMWAIFTMIVLDTRWQAWHDAKTVETGVATLVQNAIAREFEVYDFSLTAALADFADPATLGLPTALKRKSMLYQPASASDLGRLIVLDRNGRVIDSSGVEVSAGTDLSDRDYFQVQRARADVGFYVSDRLMGRVTHTPFIAVSRRRVASDGSFDGVVVGSIQLSFFEALFRSVHLPPASTISLVRPDGMRLARVPALADDFGANIRDGNIGKTLAKGSGTYQAVAASDGVNRLFAFSRIGTLPLYVIVGISTREVFRNWRWEMLVIGAGFAILSALILLLGVNLRNELDRRGEAERRLAELASTDHLTQLANRRRFDEVLRAEWRRGSRAGSSLSLLMVDGDFFKSFNDTYGHLEGDRVLRAIAAALQTCVDRPSDLVARYGGEEFAILLPETTGEGALMVASTIRTSIDALDLTHVAAPSGRLTVSIGVACCTPDFAVSPETLVEAADAALYLAKGEGRDRIVMAGCPTSVFTALEQGPLRAAS